MRMKHCRIRDLGYGPRRYRGTERQTIAGHGIVLCVCVSVFVSMFESAVTYWASKDLRL